MKQLKWLKIIGLFFLFLLVLFLLYFATRKEKGRAITKPNIVVHVDGGDALLNEQELNDRLLKNHMYTLGAPFNSMNIKKIEGFVRQMEEVKNTRVYKELGGNWSIEVWLRKPIARIFKKDGTSWYLDSEGNVISVTQLHASKLLVISGEIDEPLKGEKVTDIINNDSLKNIRKLDDCYLISNYVCNDSLLRPLIGQVYIDSIGDFVLIPLLGNQKIIFGSALSKSQVEDKFKRLKVFYKEGIAYEGWKKYSEINVKYDGQIVCRKREFEPK